MAPSFPSKPVEMALTLDTPEGELFLTGESRRNLRKKIARQLARLAYNSVEFGKDRVVYIVTPVNTENESCLVLDLRATESAFDMWVREGTQCAEQVSLFAQVLAAGNKPNPRFPIAWWAPKQLVFWSFQRKVADAFCNAASDLPLIPCM
ncbi:MAG: hypothetical protein WDN10_00735 [bacterium]